MTKKQKNKKKKSKVQQLGNIVTSAVAKAYHQNKVPVAKSILGAFMSNPANAAIGGTLAGKLFKLFGKGDYSSNDLGKLEYNSLIRSAPRLEARFQSEHHMTRVTNREYLGDIVGTGSTAFSARSFQVQPGLWGGMPWGSATFGSFERYRIRGIVYEFISSTSANVIGSAGQLAPMGNILMTCQYRSDAPTFASRLQMENSDDCVSVRPDQKIMYGLECAYSTQNDYYVRSGSTITPSITEDYAKLTIAQVGVNAAAGQIIGELWVAYDIEVFMPKMPLVIGGYSNEYRSGVTNAAPLGTVSGGDNYLGASYPITLTSTGIYFSVGTIGSAPIGMVYDITVYWAGNSTAIVVSLPTFTDVSAVCPAERSGTGALFVPASGTTTSIVNFVARVTITGPNPSIVFPGTYTLPASINNCQVIVRSVGAQGPYSYDSTY